MPLCLGDQDVKNDMAVLVWGLMFSKICQRRFGEDKPLLPLVHKVLNKFTKFVPGMAPPVKVESTKFQRAASDLAANGQGADGAASAGEGAGGEGSGTEGSVLDQPIHQDSEADLKPMPKPKNESKVVLVELRKPLGIVFNAKVGATPTPTAKPCVVRPPPGESWAVLRVPSRACDGGAGARRVCGGACKCVRVRGGRRVAKPECVGNDAHASCLVYDT